MTGLVHELQRDALDPKVSVSDLLRKALVVSRKLNIPDIIEWLSHELNGYPPEDDLIPDYRQVRGSPKVWNPYHGWQPIIFEDNETADAVSIRKNFQAIGEIDDLVSREDSRQFQMEFPSEIYNVLIGMMDVPLQPTLMIPRTALIGVLDTVRNKVLEWALELEGNGVIGEGMSFTEKEKLAAHSVTYQVTNNIGSMTNSQFQQDSPYASQALSVNNDLTQVAKFIETLKGQLEDLQLEQSQEQELKAEVVTIESQLSSPKPKPVIVNESLKSIRSVLEGVTGSLIASGLLTQLRAFLA